MVFPSWLHCNENCRCLCSLQSSQRSHMVCRSQEKKCHLLRKASCQSREILALRRLASRSQKNLPIWLGQLDRQRRVALCCHRTKRQRWWRGQQLQSKDQLEVVGHQSAMTGTKRICHQTSHWNFCHVMHITERKASQWHLKAEPALKCCQKKRPTLWRWARNWSLENIVTFHGALVAHRKPGRPWKVNWGGETWRSLCWPSQCSTEDFSWLWEKHIIIQISVFDHMHRGKGGEHGKHQYVSWLKKNILVCIAKLDSCSKRLLLELGRGLPATWTGSQILIQMGPPIWISPLGSLWDPLRTPKASNLVPERTQARGNCDV